MIATGRLDNVLATIALQPATASRILARNRAAMRDGWALFEKWQRSFDGLVHAHRRRPHRWRFPRLATSLDSVEIGERLSRDASTLVCPGDYFGARGHVRLNVGFGTDYVARALEAMTPVVRAMCEEAPQ